MDLNKILKLVLILAIIVIAGSISYYHVIFLPQKESEKLELQRQEQLVKERIEQEAKKETEIKEQLIRLSLEQCLSQAEKEYDECLGMIANYIKEGGKITPENLDALEKDCLKDFETAKDTCVKKYPIR